MNPKSFNGFYKKSLKERQRILCEEFSLTKQESELLSKEGPLSLETADRMIENVVGTFPLPYGLATNFVIDGRDYIIPFVLEEPSVVAAASNAAKLSNGFMTDADEPIMLGHIQLLAGKYDDADIASRKILEKKKELLNFLKQVDPVLERHGGGPRDLLVKKLSTRRGEMLEVQLLVDVRDAMGANAVNTMLEKLAPKLSELTGFESRLKIISNLAIYRKARAKTTWTKEKLEESFGGELKGSEIVERMLDAYEFACATPFRAATHNKGIMNGVDAVAIAAGNDFRAIEAGAHAFAGYGRNYSPLTKFYKDKKGDLVGEIELPLSLGLVGGATKTHPLAQLSLKILGVKSAQQLARIIAAVGLAQNFSAMRAIVTTGIQKGHMKLHAKNVALQAGARGEEIDSVAEKMVAAGEVSQAKAEELIKGAHSGKSMKRKK